MLDVYDTGVQRGITNADREEENKRAAFTLSNTTEFFRLSKEQKVNIQYTLETGKFKA